MRILFHKYQGTGNDFVMLNNLDNRYSDLSLEQIRLLCDRRFGIGGDGLIRINAHPTLDFEMDYFNSDGTKSFCGNGARCSVAFAETLGIPVENTQFQAIDGMHNATKLGDLITLEMNDVAGIESHAEAFVLQTGSPHFVRSLKDLETTDIVEYGKSIRYSPEFEKEGINVNLMERLDNETIRIATYERGVEDETLSCGTGATACALTHGKLEALLGKNEVKVIVKGGELVVGFTQQADGSFTHITLAGPAEFVFKGEMDV